MMDEAFLTSIAHNIVQHHQARGLLHPFQHGLQQAHNLLFSPVHMAWFDLTMASSFQAEPLSIKGSRRRHETI